MTPLFWFRDSHSWVAVCGEERQGEARVAEYRDGWAWVVDMLPCTDEAVIRTTRTLPTESAAKAEAERQVKEWPTPIEGARRL